REPREFYPEGRLIGRLRLFDALDLELQDLLGPVGDLDLIADAVPHDPDDPLVVREDRDAVADGLRNLVVDEELLELGAPPRAQRDEVVAELAQPDHERAGQLLEVD